MNTRPSTQESIINNIRMLLKEFHWRVPQLELKSGVPRTTIYSILNKNRIPGIDTTDQIAQAFGLTGWELLYPNLTADLAKRGKLEQLIDQYSNASQAAQDYVNEILNREKKLGHQ